MEAPYGNRKWLFSIKANIEASKVNVLLIYRVDRCINKRVQELVVMLQMC